MKQILMMGSVAVLSLGLMVSAACSDSDTTTASGGNGGNGATGGSTGGDGGSGATGGNAGGGGAGPIEIPAIGAQIDRKGRPAINTATINTFDIAAVGMTPDADETRATAEAAYNNNDDPSTWATTYAADIRDSLAILDSIDGVCGNQAFIDDPLAIGAGFEDYNTLAAVLANDWLVVDTANSGAANCGFLGVELELLGTDAGACGGRLPSDDVMDAIYGAVSTGNPADTTYNDGIPAPNAALETAFPYLADPN